MEKEKKVQAKKYAIVALKDILVKALGAVETKGYSDGYAAALPNEAIALLEGWDLEFAQMPREEQAVWLIQLFETLIEHG